MQESLRVTALSREMGAAIAVSHASFVQHRFDITERDFICGEMMNSATISYLSLTFVDPKVQVIQLFFQNVLRAQNVLNLVSRIADKVG